MHQDMLPGTFFGPSTLVDLVRHRIHYQPDDTAFTYLVDGENEEVRITYRELDRQARAIGAWLETSGLAGERALLLYPPGLEFIAAFMGCLYGGVVAVPVYPPRRNRSLGRIQAIADDAQARVALTTDVVLQRVEPLIDETPDLKRLTWLATCHAPVGIEEHWHRPDVHADTLAFLQYTSGSTGVPKGVMLNHANLLHNSALIAYGFEHTRSASGVFWLPSYHDMGLIGGILQPLYMGRPNILMSPMSFLQRPYRWLAAISRYRATTSGGPNFAYDLCVRQVTDEQLAELDLSSWQVAFNGAEPVREETLRRFRERFAPAGFRPEAFYPCYGMAEATLMVSGGYATKPPVIRRFDTVELGRGRAVPAESDAEGTRALVGAGGRIADQHFTIADPDSMGLCPEGTVGEIWVSGPSVALGYWRRPEATEATFRAYLKDTGQGPFLRTGDLGFVLDGELFVTGRIKDLIIVHGVNHYPQDIEFTVQQAHSRLRKDCGGVFTVEEEGRERLVVVQEIERRKQGDLEPVFDAVRRAVSREHELTAAHIVLIQAGSIPKTSSGKIQRHACREEFLAETLAVVGRWDASVRDETAAGEAAAPRESRPVARAAAAAAEPVAKEAAMPPAAAGGGRRGSSANGRSPAAHTSSPAKTTIDIVLEEVHRVAKERAEGLTLDSVIVEMGLDSLERMEIANSIEERFGGRFPEEILGELETCRDLVEAVEKYLGTTPRPRVAVAGAEVPEAHYRIERFPECIQLRESLEMLASSGLGNPYFAVHEGLTNDRTRIGGRELINFSSYNYVGMSGDPTVVRATQEATARYGTSASASRLVSGEKDLHRALEQAVSNFLDTEDAIAFVSGHATNETVIGHLFGPGDLILHDALSHNSIVQGCILSGARRRPFPHNDWQAAGALLEQFRHEYRRVLIVIEGVYSMDGDIPDLPRFVEVKRRHKALLMVDEAHSIGTIGETGRGIAEYHGVDRNAVEIWMATLSKTFGSCGGYIAGSRALIEYLKYTAPGFVYSVGLSPPNTAAALASLRLLAAEPQRVARLQARSQLFLALAREAGLNTGMSHDSPVVPVILGNSIHSLRLSKALFDRGVNVQPILHPAVEERAARLRFFLTSQHTEAQIRGTIAALVEELRRIDPHYLERPTAQAEPVKNPR